MAPKRNAISGQFSSRLIEMLESFAYRTLSVSAHKVMSRIEVELGHHAGKDNGRLPVTYEQFAEYGMDRHAIAPAIRELVALGFIEVTEHGAAGNAEFRRPSKFRLTYRHAKGADGDGTHEWRRITSKEQAEAMAKAARSDVGKSRISVGENNRVRCAISPPKSEIPGGGNPHYVSSGENPHYLYISGGVAQSAQAVAAPN